MTVWAKIVCHGVMVLAPLLCGHVKAHESDAGLVRTATSLSVTESLDRLEVLVRLRGMRVFARIDHAAGAAEAGLALRPTAVLLFGHPKGGTPFMQCGQSVGIDLPLKVLAWTDADGQTWLGYDDPAVIAHRHGVFDCPAVNALRTVLAGLVTQVR